ncbi:MAG: alpha/beta hydrolase [Proteobacteria bacterium]|nr:alpha/beta hydrolase [Pseudomonadota bacterium]
MTLRIVLPLLASLLFGCSSPVTLNGEGPSGGQQLVIGEKFSMHSEVLGEDRDYWVYLPPSYGTSRGRPTYPVLYLLDGDVHFQAAIGVVDHMSPHQIPELIVVGIPSPNRMMDLSPTESTLGLDGKAHPEYDGKTGGGQDFLRFMREELFPKVEDTYQASDHRILAGHSAGGLLALYALLDQPDMFDGHLAMDPSLWWDDQLLLKQAEAVLAEGHGRKASVYMSLANNSDCKTPGCWPMMQANGRDFAASLERAKTTDFNFTHQYFDDESHGSVPLVSLYYGLPRVLDAHP